MRVVSVLRALIGCASLFCAVPAWAEQPRDGEPTARSHDGFYFRWAIGPSYTADWVDSDAVGEASFTGFGIAEELLFGGTPAPGLVIGGGILGTNVIAPRLEVEGERAEAPNLLQLSALGAFADYYFDPRAGFHVQLFMGLSVLSADDSTARENPLGAALAIAGGHEWWIGEQWSAGVLARVLGSRMWFGDSTSDIDERHSVISPALLFSLTLH